MKASLVYNVVLPCLLLAVLLVSSCAERRDGNAVDTAQEDSVPAVRPPPDYQDGGESPASTESRDLIWFDQGWTREEAVDFYFTSQGSQLVPYSWFLALEQAESHRLFRDEANVRRFGYIPQDRSPGINPDGLPIGFVKDDVPEDFLSGSGDLHKSRLASGSGNLYTEYREWLGLTCAACHTSEMVYGNKTLRVDGGPPLSDFQSLIEGMSAALGATIKDDAKMTRFAKNVLAEGGYNETERRRLKGEATAFLAWLNNYIEINYGGLATPYGYGRLDAFGAILNRVTSSFTGIPNNATPANAPVSYPFLWNTSRLSWVQWNGSANNHIGRNVGEVCGVFAHVIVDTPDDSLRFDSSARIMNLYQLEEWMGKLDSPKWSAPLPPIDQVKAEKGKALYAKNCVDCHSIRDANGKFPMTPPNPVGAQFIDINMVAIEKIRTDPLMAMNFVNPAFNVDPGIVRPYLPEEYRGSAEVPRAVMLSVVVGAVIQKQLAAANPPLDESQLLALSGYHLSEDKGGPSPPNLVAYKARPLNGVWATAPYLHNGSVPNLDQLLKPEAKRGRSFFVGSREFDPVKVGFVPKPGANAFRFETVDARGRLIPGNSNVGHSGPRHTSTRGQNGEWRNFTDDERAQLIEYLKTL